MSEAGDRSSRQALEQLIERMRADGSRFRIFAGSNEVVNASTVDDWANELAAVLSSGGTEMNERDFTSEKLSLVKAMKPLACPLCGGVAYAVWTVNGEQMFKVGCPPCGLELKAAWYRNEDKPTKDILALWNTRAAVLSSGPPVAPTEHEQILSDYAASCGLTLGQLREEMRLARRASVGLQASPAAQEKDSK